MFFQINPKKAQAVTYHINGKIVIWRVAKKSRQLGIESDVPSETVTFSLSPFFSSFHLSGHEKIGLPKDHTWLGPKSTVVSLINKFRSAIVSEPDAVCKHLYNITSVWIRLPSRKGNVLKKNTFFFLITPADRRRMEPTDLVRFFLLYFCWAPLCLSNGLAAIFRLIDWWCGLPD